jgi:hypothetical protein
MRMALHSALNGSPVFIRVLADIAAARRSALEIPGLLLELFLME